MEKRKYLINMHTPIGGKKGKMTVIIEGNRINGEIELLQQLAPFEGDVKENGECKITGNLKSLMRTIQYTARGKITPTELQLKLESDHRTFIICGEPMVSQVEY